MSTHEELTDAELECVAAGKDAPSRGAFQRGGPLGVLLFRAANPSAAPLRSIGTFSGLGRIASAADR